MSGACLIEDGHSIGDVVARGQFAERVGEGFVDFSAELFGGGAEGAGEFGCCEGCEESGFEGGFDFCWELVDAFAVGCCEAVAEAEEGEELVAHAGEHVFG